MDGFLEFLTNKILQNIGGNSTIGSEIVVPVTKKLIQQ